MHLREDFHIAMKEDVKATFLVYAWGEREKERESVKVREDHKFVVRCEMPKKCLASAGLFTNIKRFPSDLGLPLSACVVCLCL